MRIAMIAPPWAPIPPNAYGGIEVIVDLLARGLQEAGHDVSLFATGDSTCPVPRQWALPLAEGDRIGHAVPELLHVQEAYDVLRDCDIVHDHTILGPHLRDRHPDAPVVTTVHGPLDGELRPLYRRIARDVPIVTISRSQRAAAPEIPVARVIHHGIDSRQLPFGRGDGGYALFLGRMSADKGAHRAIEAASRARVPLVMAAKMREAEERAYFDEFVLPRLDGSIVYSGEVDHARKLELLAGACALLFPIRWREPFGMVMLEALACGTPVIAFPEGAAPEIVEHGRTGFLCHDEQEMADALGRVHEIDRRACRAAVEGYFSAGRMVDEHVALYESVLAGTAGQATPSAAGSSRCDDSTWWASGSGAVWSSNTPV